LKSLERTQLFNRGYDFVVGIAELVAPCTYIYIGLTYLVDCDLNRCSDQRGHNFPVIDVIGSRPTEIAVSRDIAEQAGLLKPAPYIAQLELTLVVGKLFSNIARLNGSGLLAGRGFTRATKDNLIFVARDRVL
jgi:hypothetical protein